MRVDPSPWIKNKLKELWLELLLWRNLGASECLCKGDVNHHALTLTQGQSHDYVLKGGSLSIFGDKKPWLCFVIYHAIEMRKR